MQFEADVALLGTGVAPLLAANELLAKGKSVLVLNPERDFFLEGSELPLDPCLPSFDDSLTDERLKRSMASEVADALRPHFPGPIEVWPSEKGNTPSNPEAPVVRARSRVWIRSETQPKEWDRIERYFLQSPSAGEMRPRLLEGLAAARRFPGFSKKEAEHVHGMITAPLADCDVDRYCAGQLGYVRERLGRERVVCQASPVEVLQDGVRFQSNNETSVVRLKDGFHVFWTPRLHAWIQSQRVFSEPGNERPTPKGVRLWEEWKLLSRDGLDASMAAVWKQAVVWAFVEGAPEEFGRGARILQVLRDVGSVPVGQNWNVYDRCGTPQSLQELEALCVAFLGWEKFSVRGLRARALFEWDAPRVWRSLRHPYQVQLITGCEGPLADIVRRIRNWVEEEE